MVRNTPLRRARQGNYGSSGASDSESSQSSTDLDREIRENGMSAKERKGAAARRSSSRSKPAAAGDADLAMDYEYMELDSQSVLSIARAASSMVAVGKCVRLVPV